MLSSSAPSLHYDDFYRPLGLGLELQAYFHDQSSFRLIRETVVDLGTYGALGVSGLVLPKRWCQGSFFGHKLHSLVIRQCG